VLHPDVDSISTMGRDAGPLCSRSWRCKLPTRSPFARRRCTVPSLSVAGAHGRDLARAVLTVLAVPAPRVLRTRACAHQPVNARS
jgi:hypothetical protein